MEQKPTDYEDTDVTAEGGAEQDLLPEEEQRLERPRHTEGPRLERPDEDDDQRTGFSRRGEPRKNDLEEEQDDEEVVAPDSGGESGGGNERPAAPSAGEYEEEPEGDDFEEGPPLGEPQAPEGASPSARERRNKKDAAGPEEEPDTADTSAEEAEVIPEGGHPGDPQEAIPAGEPEAPAEQQAKEEGGAAAEEPEIAGPPAEGPAEEADEQADQQETGETSGGTEGEAEGQAGETPEEGTTEPERPETAAIPEDTAAEIEEALSGSSSLDELFEGILQVDPDSAAEHLARAEEQDRLILAQLQSLMEAVEQAKEDEAFEQAVFVQSVIRSIGRAEAAAQTGEDRSGEYDPGPQVIQQARDWLKDPEVRSYVEAFLVEALQVRQQPLDRLPNYMARFGEILDDGQQLAFAQRLRLEIEVLDEAGEDEKSLYLSYRYQEAFDLPPDEQQRWLEELRQEFSELTPEEAVKRTRQIQDKIGIPPLRPGVREEVERAAEEGASEAGDTSAEGDQEDTPAPGGTSPLTGMYHSFPGTAREQVEYVEMVDRMVLTEYQPQGEKSDQLIKDQAEFIRQVLTAVIETVETTPEATEQDQPYFPGPAVITRARELFEQSAIRGYLEEAFADWIQRTTPAESTPSLTVAQYMEMLTENLERGQRAAAAERIFMIARSLEESGQVQQAAQLMIRAQEAWDIPLDEHGEWLAGLRREFGQPHEGSSDKPDGNE